MGCAVENGTLSLFTAETTPFEYCVFAGGGVVSWKAVDKVVEGGCCDKIGIVQPFVPLWMLLEAVDA